MIKTRRSVREFKQDQIPDDEIKFLIDCARYAPTGFNTQPWSFLVIKNKDTMRKISESGKKSMIPLLEPMKDSSQKARDFLVFLKTKGTDMFYNAPVLVIILGNKSAPTVDFDCSMAAQNMMLAAHSKGTPVAQKRGISSASHALNRGSVHMIELSGHQLSRQAIPPE